MKTQHLATSGFGVASGIPDEDAEVVERGTAPVPQVSVRRKTYVDAIKRHDYIPPDHFRNCARAAHFIVWCSVNYPEIMLDWCWVYAAINQLVTAQRPTSKEVRVLQARASDISKVMLKYNVMIVTELGGHVRGAANNDDAAEKSLRKKKVLADRAQHAMLDIARRINPSEMHNKKLATWVVQVQNSIRSLEATTKRLAAPPPLKSPTPGDVKKQSWE